MLLRPEYDMKLVGHNLRRLRRAKKLSVETVREYLCLGSVQAIYKYEKGKCYPQADTLLALMELYDADIFDITRDHKEDDKSSYFFVTLNPSGVSPNKKPAAEATGFQNQFKLLCSRCAYRTDRCAGSAVNTKVCVNNHLAVTLADS